MKAFTGGMAPRENNSLKGAPPHPPQRLGERVVAVMSLSIRQASERPHELFRSPVSPAGERSLYAASHDRPSSTIRERRRSATRTEPRRSNGATYDRFGNPRWSAPRTRAFHSTPPGQ